MSADAITAVCVVVIAVASLIVTVYQTHATRRHNRHSVRPMLQLRHTRTVVAGFDRNEHAEVEDLVTRRLTLTIRYGSLYGGEDDTTVLRSPR